MFDKVLNTSLNPFNFFVGIKLIVFLETMEVDEEN